MDACTLQFVGTATTVLRLGPFTLLTDPNFLHRGQRAYLGHGLWSTRLTEPTPDVRGLPALDAVVLSHMHGDHWDRVDRRHLPRSVPIMTTPKAARALLGRASTRRGRYPPGRRPTCSATVTPSRSRPHRAATPSDSPGTCCRRSWAASWTTHRPPGRGCGCTSPATRSSWTSCARSPERFPDVHTAILHLGGTTLPGGAVVTMDAQQGADLLELVRPTVAVPVHFEDYGVFKSPLSAFVHEARRRGLDDMVRVVRPGQVTTLVADSDSPDQDPAGAPSE